MIRFSTSKNSVSVKVLVALGAMGAAGIASATSCTTCSQSVSDLTTAENEGLARGVVTVTGINTVVNISNTVSGLVSGGAGSAGGGAGFAALPAGVTRFALPGQGGTGAAAAPGGKPFNAWFGYSRADIGYEYSPLSSDGHVDVYLLGVDYTLKNNIVIGLAIAWDRSDINLTGNRFGAGGNNKLHGDGTTYTPYVGIPINQNWSADLSAGWGQTDVDTNVLGTSSTTEIDRTTFAAGLTYRRLFGADNKWLLTGRGGYIYVKDKLDNGKVEVSQVRFGGQAAYNMGTFVPYAGLSYIYDFDRTNVPGAANDRDGFQGTLGIRFSVPNGFYGGLQYSSEFSRDQIKNNQILLNLGTRF